MNKKGVSLTVLIVSIAVIAVLTVATVYFGDKVLTSIRDAKYIADVKEVKEALEMYNSRCLARDRYYDSTYLQWDGSGLPSNTGKIIDGTNEDTIQTIFSTDAIPSGIAIENGKIVSNSSLTAEQISLLEQIQVYIESNRNLLTYANYETTINGVNVKIEDTGYITLNGTPTQNCFIKLSGVFKTATSANDLLVTGEKIAEIGDKLKLKITPESGNVIGHNGTVISETEFNIILRSTASQTNLGGQATAYRIQMLDLINNPPPEGIFSYPSDGNYEETDKDLSCVYIFTKGPTLEFKNYRFKLELLKKVERVDTEYVTNDFNIPVGRVVEGNGITVDVTEDYNIVINGTTTAKSYIALLPDSNSTPSVSRSIITSTLSNIAGRIKLCIEQDNLNPIITNGTNITFEVDEVSGTRSGVTTGSQVNVLLRNYENATTSNVSKYGTDDSTQFNAKMLSKAQPINISIPGTVINGDVYILGIYITGGLTFTDYTIKPSITVTQ